MVATKSKSSLPSISKRGSALKLIENSVPNSCSYPFCAEGASCQATLPAKTGGFIAILKGASLSTFLPSFLLFFLISFCSFSPFLLIFLRCLLRFFLRPLTFFGSCSFSACSTSSSKHSLRIVVVIYVKVSIAFNTGCSPSIAISRCFVAVPSLLPILYSKLIWRPL